MTAPRLSDDQQLPASGTGTRCAPFDLADLQEGGALLIRWSDVRADLGSLGAPGLRSREDRHPVLLAPARIEMLGFDDIAQSYLLRMIDGTGDALSLIIPAQDAATASWLTEAGGKLRGLLCLRNPQSSAANSTLAPICVMTETKRDLVITNLAFDPLPDTKSLVKALTQRWRGAPLCVRASHDPLSTTVQTSCGIWWTCCRAGPQTATG